MKASNEIMTPEMNCDRVIKMLQTARRYNLIITEESEVDERNGWLTYRYVIERAELPAGVKPTLQQTLEAFDQLCIFVARRVEGGKWSVIYRCSDVGAHRERTNRIYRLSEFGAPMEKTDRRTACLFLAQMAGVL